MNDHLATWAAEVATSPEEQTWFAWIATAQTIAGHDLDGDEREDGYSLDVAYQAFRDGKTPRDYILTIPGAALIPNGYPELSEHVQREHIEAHDHHLCEETPDVWPCKNVVAARRNRRLRRLRDLRDADEAGRRVRHLMNDALLDACGLAPAGGLVVTPVLGDVTCPACRKISVQPANVTPDVFDADQRLRDALAAEEAIEDPRQDATCGASLWDGNRDDPSYAYCIRPISHPGPHQYEI